MPRRVEGCPPFGRLKPQRRSCVFCCCLQVQWKRAKQIKTRRGGGGVREKMVNTLQGILLASFCAVNWIYLISTRYILVLTIMALNVGCLL